MRGSRSGGPGTWESAYGDGAAFFKVTNGRESSALVWPFTRGARGTVSRSAMDK